MCGCKGKCGCNIVSTTKGEKGDSAPILPYYSYKGLITQSSGNPSVIQIYSDTKIGTLSFVKDSAGYYKCDLSTIVSNLGITSDAIYYSITDNVISSSKIIKIIMAAGNVLEIYTYDTGVLSDGIMTKTPIFLQFHI